MEYPTFASVRQLVELGFIVVYGLCIGSFLNVCIYRLPREKSVVRPRSFCPQCNKTIPWYDNIPVLSYLVLRGRCRFCHTKISLQYIIVELLTGMCALGIYHVYGLTWIGFIYFVFVCGLIVSTFVDFNFRIIPDEISVGGLVIGLLCGLAVPQLHQTNHHLTGLLRSFIGLLVGGGIIWFIGIIGDFIFKKETMGGGDVKLLAMIGSFLGWKLTLVTFFIAPVFGSIVGIIIKLKTKSSLIAYGPYLSLAAVVSLFFGEEIIHWLFFSRYYY